MPPPPPPPLPPFSHICYKSRVGEGHQGRSQRSLEERGQSRREADQKICKKARKYSPSKIYCSSTSTASSLFGSDSHLPFEQIQFLSLRCFYLLSSIFVRQAKTIFVRFVPIFIKFNIHQICANIRQICVYLL